MKRFKVADISVNVFLIAAFIIYDIVQQNLRSILWQYYVIGSLQMISMLIHYVNGWFMNTESKRVAYSKIIAGILAVAAIGLFYTRFLFLFSFGMLFIAPCFALYYVWICYHELHFKMKRPISLLK